VAMAISEGLKIWKEKNSEKGEEAAGKKGKVDFFLKLFFF
jgi:hypothetical protein